jgi:hypothetical protein
MTNLSRSAQAVLNTVLNEAEPRSAQLQAIADAAAVLRVAADQVVPPDPYRNDCCITQCEQIRAELLAIATELEGRFPPCLFQEKAV